VWQAIVAVIGLVGSAAGAIWAAYVGTRRRVLAELEGQYDADLRDSRLEVYPHLWAATQPLAKWAREPPGFPTFGELEQLGVTLRRWYFEQGGLYLSAESREAYFQVQTGLAAVVARGDATHGQQVDEEVFDALRTIASWLRTTLTYDVGTRRRFSLAPEWQQEDDDANRAAIEEDRAAKREAARLTEALEARS
jgi:hypothetical protein